MHRRGRVVGVGARRGRGAPRALVAEGLRVEPERTRRPPEGRAAQDGACPRRLLRRRTSSTSQALTRPNCILFEFRALRGLRRMPPVSPESGPSEAPCGPPARATEALRRRMHWLLGLTFVHVFGEGGLALFEAVRTGSLALLAFGLESIIEGGAAFLAVRHLRHLADEEEDHARRDQMLARWIGVSFLLLAAYTLRRGVIELVGGNARRAEPARSPADDLRDLRHADRRIFQVEDEPQRSAARVWPPKRRSRSRARSTPA